MAGVACKFGLREWLRTDEFVVVGQFDTGLNVADSFNVDPPILVNRFRIGIAGMIDEAGIVAVAARVDNGTRIHSKEKRVVMVSGLPA